MSKLPPKATLISNLWPFISVRKHIGDSLSMRTSNISFNAKQQHEGFKNAQKIVIGRYDQMQLVVWNASLPFHHPLPILFLQVNLPNLIER